MPASDLLLGTWVSMEEGRHMPSETTDEVVFTKITRTSYAGGQPEVRLYSPADKTCQPNLRTAAKDAGAICTYFT